VRPSAGGALRARVIGSSVLGDSFSTHVSYEILVSDAAGARWLVQRRFSNFEALHKRVKALRARGRYKLPPKRILFHGTEGGFMDTRKELLDRYLQDMLADARLCACAELWDFLSAHSRSYVPAPGGGGVLKSVSVGLSAGLDSAVERVSTGVHVVRAELADASRRLDRKLERMKERWERLDGDAASSGAEERGGESLDDATRDAQQAAASSSTLPARGGSALSLSMASSAADEGYASSTDTADDGAAVSSADASVPPAQHAHADADDAAAAAEFAPGTGDAAGDPDPAGLSLPLLDLADAIFRLRDKGWVQRRMLSFARGVAELFVGGAVDEALAAKLAQLRRGDTLVRLLRLLRDTLWPGGVWYRTRIVAAARAAGVEPPPTAPLGFGGVPPGREAEAAEDARAVRALLLQRSSSVALEQLVGRDAYRRGTLEVYHLLQSPLFVRQIGHNLLEALLVRLRAVRHMLACLQMHTR
jgi:sorting nexin-13